MFNLWKCKCGKRGNFDMIIVFFLNIAISMQDLKNLLSPKKKKVNYSEMFWKRSNCAFKYFNKWTTHGHLFLQRKNPTWNTKKKKNCRENKKSKDKFQPSKSSFLRDIRHFFCLLQIAQCNFTPITLAPLCIAQSHHMTVKSSQTNLWELLKAAAITGNLRRAHKSYFSSVQITVLNGVLGS